MKKKICFLAMFLISVCIALSQQPNEQLKAQLEITEQKMFDCFSNGDKKGFAEITGGDYLTINADGTYMGKQEAVNLIEKFKGSTNKIIQKETRFYNDIAITTGRIKFYIKSLLVADVFFTQTWVFKDNRWLFIGWQGTMTGQPKNYPVYITLLLVMILLGMALLIKRVIRKREKNHSN